MRTSINRLDVGLNSFRGTGGSGPAFIPSNLFSSGEQGVWYDPSDLSSMFQDAAGTTPVTAAGQPVGRINDKSGRNNHATQTTAASRPLLQEGGGKYWLEFDGVDDFLRSEQLAADVTTYTRLGIAIGTRTAAPDTVGRSALCYVGGVSEGEWILSDFQDDARFRLWGAANSNTPFLDGVYTSATDVVTGVLANITAATGPEAISFRKNKAQIGTGSISPAGTVWAQRRIIVGQDNAGGYYTGRVYNVVVCFKDMASDIGRTEDYVNQKTGAY
jgi:hypothetical protein